MNFTNAMTRIFDPKVATNTWVLTLSIKLLMMATTLHYLLSKLHSGLSGLSLVVLCCLSVLLLLNERLSGQELKVSDSWIAVEVLNTFGGGGSVYGIKTDVSGSGTGFHYGNSLHVSGNGSSNRYGTHVAIDGNGNGNHFGSYNTLTSSGTGGRYGTYSILNGGSGTQYGNYLNISTTNDAGHYGNYLVLNGGGSGDHIGSHVTLSGSGSGLQYAAFHRVTNTNNDWQIGTFNRLEGTGSGGHIGCSNVITAGSGSLYGTYTIINETDGNGSHYGNYNVLTGSGSGTHYGNYNVLSGAGSGSHYGTYNVLTSSGSGSHIAGYFSASGPENFAAIFNTGHVVANNAGLDYDFTVKGLNKDYQLFVDANDGTVGIGTGTPSDALHIVGEGTDDLLRIQLGTSTKMRIFNNGSISLGNNNTAIDPGDVYIANQLGVQRSNPSFPIHVGTSGSNGNGAHVTGGGTWTNGSSREFKENFGAVDSEKILERLFDLDILRWNYKESNEGDHIGPMAEDFYAAFALGHDAHYISTVDADGVALAAIKGLYSKLLEAQNEIIHLENTLHAMRLYHEERFAELEQTVSDLRTIVQQQVK